MRTTLPLLGVLLLAPLATLQAADPAARGPLQYEPTEASLRQAEVPDNFDLWDSKLSRISTTRA